MCTLGVLSRVLGTGLGRGGFRLGRPESSDSDSDSDSDTPKQAGRPITHDAPNQKLDSEAPHWQSPRARTPRPPGRGDGNPAGTGERE